MQLAAGTWRGLGPRLVDTAGLFPERTAQGRGTCSSLRHWSRALTGGWDTLVVVVGWKDALRFQERGRDPESSGRAERPSLRRNICPPVFPPRGGEEQRRTASAVPGMKSRDWTGG